MGAGRPYFGGFRLDGPVQPGDVSPMPAAAVNIRKGDFIIDNGAGYVTNASVTAVAAGTGFVAIEDCDNSGGSNGTLSVLCIPVNLAKNKWWVPNESATVAAQTDVGEVVDLESEDGIDVTDTTTTGYGFAIEEIDISAEAIVASAGGFVKGRFITV